MPRGVYDRSKTKKAAPAVTESKTSEKKARAPWGSKKAAKQTEQAVDVPLTGTTGYSYEPSLMELANLRQTISSNKDLLTKVDLLIGRKLDQYIGEKTAGAVKTEAAPVVQQAPAPVQAQAPVQIPAPVQAVAPFNPAVPPNGQA